MQMRVDSCKILSNNCFVVATRHWEDVATNTTMQGRYELVVTPVATPKDVTTTGKTSMNNKAEKGTQHISRNTLKTSPVRFPPSAYQITNSKQTDTSRSAPLHLQRRMHHLLSFSPHLHHFPLDHSQLIKIHRHHETPPKPALKRRVSNCTTCKPSWTLHMSQERRGRKIWSCALACIFL